MAVVAAATTTKVTLPTTPKGERIADHRPGAVATITLDPPASFMPLSSLFLILSPDVPPEMPLWPNITTIKYLNK